MGLFSKFFSKDTPEYVGEKIILNQGARLNDVGVNILFIIKNGNVIYVNYDSKNLFETDRDGDSLFKGRVVNYKFRGETTKDETQIFIGFDENDSYMLFTLQANLQERLDAVGKAVIKFFSDNRINGVFSWEGLSVEYHYTYKLYNKGNINLLINVSQVDGYIINENSFEYGEGDFIKEKFWRPSTNTSTEPDAYTSPEANTLYSVSSNCIKSNNDSANKIYEQGVESLKDTDFKMAFSSFKIAAKFGHTSATYNLALMYKNGIGCEYNYDDSLRLFKKAQLEGHQNASPHINGLEKAKNLASDLSNFPQILNEASYLHDGIVLYFFYFFILDNLNEEDSISWIRYELDCASIGNELAQHYVHEICPNSDFYHNGRNELTPRASDFSDFFDAATIPLRKEEDFSDIIKLRCNLVNNLFKRIFN